ncbi:MAG: WYL domain-containing protein [Eubacteriales bacterium]|nr:WYL domain-containing protein [Eubacteriales bacterium]
MSYSELIKDFSRIRDYMREFFVYGFKSREEIDIKSARSYDNERRRIESWLSEYMSFHQDTNGKNVFISVDSRRVTHNPLYQAWKAKSFTKNDITLHFWLMDILSPDKTLSLTEILDTIDSEYISFFLKSEPIDESTIRKKLKEYVDLGLIAAEKRGKQLVYKLPADKLNLQSWKDATCFFAETDPLGVIGSFLQDKLKSLPEYYAFKHNYLLFAPDSGIVLDLLAAINVHKRVELEIIDNSHKVNKRRIILPLKIFISAQSGRQYVAGCNTRTKRFKFFRLDSVLKIKPLDRADDFESYIELLNGYRKHLWGVASGSDGHIEHLEMVLVIEAYERHIIGRLEREKRCGAVERIDDTRWRFSADVYDAQEMLPWLRTFTGRIESLSCTNKSVEERFWGDLAVLAELYGGDGDVV